MSEKKVMGIDKKDFRSIKKDIDARNVKVSGLIVQNCDDGKIGLITYENGLVQSITERYERVNINGTNTSGNGYHSMLSLTNSMKK